MKILLFYLLFPVLLYTSCNSANKRGQEEVDTARVSSTGIVMDNDTLSAVFAAYINLKDHLVNSDVMQSKSAASTLAQSLKDIHGCEQTADLSEDLSNMNSLDSQRMIFSAISTDLIAMYKSDPLNAGKIYVMHCPMFNQKRGAYWLSTSTEIKNPYYGEKMLTCGNIAEEID